MRRLCADFVHYRLLVNEEAMRTKELKE